MVCEKFAAEAACHTMAGTVLKLGTKRHHDQLLERIDSLQATGCFALTELGFGEPVQQSGTACALHGGRT